MVHDELFRGGGGWRRVFPVLKLFWLLSSRHASPPALLSKSVSKDDVE